jgi:hypothetical protein
MGEDRPCAWQPFAGEQPKCKHVGIILDGLLKLEGRVNGLVSIGGISGADGGYDAS